MLVCRKECLIPRLKTDLLGEEHSQRGGLGRGAVL